MRSSFTMAWCRGLAVAHLALELDQKDQSREALLETLAQAKAIVARAVEELKTTGVSQEQLIRDAAGTSLRMTGAPGAANGGGTIDVLICDDVDAMRMLLGAVIGLRPGLRVVGEARDGNEAISEASRLQPDAHPARSFDAAPDRVRSAARDP